MDPSAEGAGFVRQTQTLVSGWRWPEEVPCERSDLRFLCTKELESAFIYLETQAMQVYIWELPELLPETKQGQLGSSVLGSTA